MRLFGKATCAQCGTRIEKNPLRISGKIFCSQEHADEYTRNSGEGHHCCC